MLSSLSLSLSLSPLSLLPRVSCYPFPFITNNKGFAGYTSHKSTVHTKRHIQYKLSSRRGPSMMAAPTAAGSRTPPPAPPAATRMTRPRAPKGLSFGACSLSHLQSSTLRSAAKPPDLRGNRPGSIGRVHLHAWCGTGGATARSSWRLQKSLTSKHAKSMQILSHCGKYCHTHG